jgi:D-alanyl-D-alanine carboxypeptidase/D-alanyl-D-alanine-endopeptidase (penicillin-binding protein 4)
MKPVVSAFFLFFLGVPLLAPAAPDLAEVRKTVEAAKALSMDVSVVILEPGGTAILQEAPTQSVKPASNNKLFTAAAALELLGPDFRTSTVLQLTQPKQPDGTVPGHLVVHGYGDPSLSGRFEADSTDSTAPLRRMADVLKSAGIQSIQGDLIVDDSFFSGPSFHPLWPGGERGEWYSAEVSALAFNDNCVDLRWSGEGLSPSDLAKVDLIPATNYVRLTNEVRVAARGRPASRNYRRGADSNAFMVTGQIGLDQTTIDSAAIHDGALWFGHNLRDVLTSSGITLTGVVRRPFGPEESLLGPPELTWSFPSPPLSILLQPINRNSQNFYSECVLKMLAALPQTRDLCPQTTAPYGSWERGAAIASQAIARILGDSEGPGMVDGSGLSHRNRTTALQLARLTHAMTYSRHHAVYQDSLAVGATRGSLRRRFTQTTETRTLGATIYGKTGLIAGVRALTGMIPTPSGPYVFSIVLNNIQPDAANSAVARMDDIALALARTVAEDPGRTGRHPFSDREPVTAGPLQVSPRTTPIPLPNPPPDFAKEKILNETSQLWFARMALFEEQTSTPQALTTGGIVLLGDSLTERFPTEDLLPQLPIVNRGIGGDKVGGWSYLGLLDRLPISIVAPQPRAIVLQISSNDLLFANTPWENLQPNYLLLLDRIQQLAPQARLILVTTPPTRGRHAKANPAINRMNELIRRTALERKLDLIDLHAALVDDKGELAAPLAAVDDVHLSENGYRVYARLLRPILRATMAMTDFHRGQHQQP